MQTLSMSNCIPSKTEYRGEILFQLMYFLGNVCQKVLAFITHDSLDQLPVDVAMRTG